MNPQTAALILAFLRFGLQEWATRKGKPANWIPTESDWLQLEADALKTIEQYEEEARVKLGLPPENPV